MSSSPQPPGLGPADSPLRAGTRFAIELIAWVTVPWALWSTSAALAVVAGLVLIALPATCNVPGDKQITGIAVPGWFRLGIESLLYAAAAWGLWSLLGQQVGIAATALVVLAAVIQVPRWRWLLRRRLEPEG